ncbi:hypothetical protein HC931_20100 [Candidatus Gracilibacteria bacterium]|nr:hypothetical protein [Candidatus Gracilibacteria bacterium]NJP21097.1 hypothetical protein [Hydrococcus sp. CRU_1_1]
MLAPDRQNPIILDYKCDRALVVRSFARRLGFVTSTQQLLTKRSDRSL